MTSQYTGPELALLAPAGDRGVGWRRIEMDEPWVRFAVGVPSTRPNWTNPDCQPLAYIAHIAHVRAAFRIVEDGQLRADLVFDESRLNTDRIRVVWLSPNDWSGAGGFRYGNVRFSFEWPALIAGKHAYWVESIAYGIPACRILITDRNYDGLLQVYNPERARGPWYVTADGTPYWNGEYCLEVMYEADLRLDAATRVDFVDHHPRFCNMDYRSCSDRGRNATDAAVEFVGTIVADHRSLALPGFVEVDAGTVRPAYPLRQAHSRLSAQCDHLRPPAWGSLRAHDPAAPAVARALLRSLASKQLAKDAAALAAPFQSADEARRAITDIIAEAAGVADREEFFRW